MPSRNSIEIEINAKDNASGVLSGVSGGLKDFGGGLQTLGGNLTMLGAPFLAIGAVALKSFSDSQTSLANLDATLKSTGGAAGVTRQQALDLASSFQKVTKFSDETILNGESMLLTFTNIGKDVFPTATEAMLNLATKMGGDGQGAAIMLGKALNDPLKGITALTRVGVTFSQQQKDQIAQMVKMGDTAGAQKIILAEMNKEFGGQAVAAGQTFAGQMVITQNRLDDLMETIGEKLLPIAQRLIGWVGDAITWFTNLDPHIQDVIVAVGAFMASLAIIGPIIAGVGTVLSLVGGILGAIGTIIGVVLSPIGLVIAAIVALGAAYVTNFGGVRDFIDGQVRPVLERVFNWLAGVWENTIKPGLDALYQWFTQTALPAVRDFLVNTLWPDIQKVFNWLGSVWTNIIEPGLSKLYEWFIVTALPAIGQAVNDFKTNIFEPVATFIGDIWTIVGKGLEQFFNWMAAPGGGLDQIKSALNSFKTNVIDPVIKAIQDIWTKVQPFLESLKTGMKQIFDWINTNVIQPIVDRVNGFINTIHQLAGTSSGGGTVAPYGTPPKPGSHIGVIAGSRDSGGDGRKGGAYMIGKGAQPEMFIAPTNGTFIPNADKMMGGSSINIQSLIVQASGAAEGAAAGQAFMGVLDEYQSRGNR